MGRPDSDGHERASGCTALAVALAIAVVAIVVVLFTGGSGYVIHAEFSDAGQLVNGDLVTVAGHSVGSVGRITLTNNGLADVELDISDSSITPVRQGTIATVGQLSLTGVANRFVGLSLGTGSPIANGGTLPLPRRAGSSTSTCCSTRSRRRCGPRCSGSSRQARTSSGSRRQADQPVVLYFNPALSQIGAARRREIVSDRAALDQLHRASAKVSTALAAAAGPRRRGDQHRHVAARGRQPSAPRSRTSSPRAGRAPQGTAVLADTNFTLKVLDPALARPTAGRAAAGRCSAPSCRQPRNAIPTIAGVQALVPSAKRR